MNIRVTVDMVDIVGTFSCKHIHACKARFVDWVGPENHGAADSVEGKTRPLCGNTR